ncbi:MAG TPA: 30S ribosomal protein S9 [Thermoproteota archaeon]|nr:30S ribosomal protein S9 [Thermoproteota archaeon]
MPPARKLPLVVSARIKSSSARATFKPGNGSIKVNSIPIQNWGNRIQTEVSTSPVKLLPDRFKEVNVHVSVDGGGWSSQARAVKVTLANGIVKWTRSATVRKTLISYDQHMLSGDPREKEPKKFGGPGARRKFQKSYR